MAQVRRALIVQKFIDILLLFRPYFRQIRTQVYIVLLVFFFYARYHRQGNTTSVITQVLSSIVIVFGQLIDNQTVFYFGIILALLSYILEPIVYHLPEVSHKVNIIQNTQNTKVKNLYWIQCVRIDETKPFTNYEIPWAKTKQYKKMATHLGIQGELKYKIFQFVNSIPSKIKLKLAEGTQKVYNNDIILFSHGRGGTPFFYSLMIRQLSRNNKLLAPQHNQVQRTEYTDIDVCKKFRQKQVVCRANDIQYLALNKVQQNKNIILIGHSYGSSTVLQAYQNPEVKKKVSKIVLLDPWFFPNSQQVLQSPIDCPVLILANQHYMKIEYIYILMNRFLKIHDNITYFCFKNGDHLHQTDMGFINGTSMRRIKNTQCSDFIHKMNIRIISQFLAGEQKQKLQILYQDWNLTRNYKPKSWNNPGHY